MTPEQEDFLAKAKASLGAARMLAGGGLYDFAASRAYYSMFYAAQALLLGEGLTFSKHSAVIGAFGQHFAKTDRLPRELHRHLIDAQDTRILGDYGPRLQLTREDADTQISRAETFIELAESAMS